MVFYAVVRGHKPGIYTSWDACQANVSGFSRSLFKSFKTREDAVNFCRINGFDINENRESDSALRNIAAKVKFRGNSVGDVDSDSKGIKMESKSNPVVAINSDAVVAPGVHEDQGCDHNTFDFASFSQRLSNLENTFKEKMLALEARIEALESIQLFKTCDDDFLEDNIDSKASLSVPATKRSASKSVGENLVPKKKLKTSSKLTVTSPSGVSYEFDSDENGFVHVYTDGACSRNGNRGAKAGVGVWFGPGHPLNISEPVQGRATNNMAEIQAATWAIQQAIRVGVKKLLINTDSQFMINCITNWIKKWKRNGWRTTTGVVVNKEELVELDKYCQYPGIDVKWNYVRGHSGVAGNEGADSLATKAAEKYNGEASFTRHPWQLYFDS